MRCLVVSSTLCLWGFFIWNVFSLFTINEFMIIDKGKNTSVSRGILDWFRQKVFHMQLNSVNLVQVVKKMKEWNHTLRQLYNYYLVISFAEIFKHFENIFLLWQLWFVVLLSNTELVLNLHFWKSIVLVWHQLLQKLKIVILKACFATAIYDIWIERNARLYQNRTKTVALHELKTAVCIRVSHSRKLFGFVRSL